MVCPRCIKVVNDELHKIGLNVVKVELGEAIIEVNNKPFNINEIKKSLEINGFELLDDKQGKLIEKTKTLIIEKIQNGNPGSLEKFNFSKYLSENLNVTYQYISHLFSSLEDTTIEKFIIRQKIEKVKELLVYDELTLSEIAYNLGYSSVQHLSNQFKQITGFTPRYYKNLKDKKRIPLDKV